MIISKVSLIDMIMSNKSSPSIELIIPKLSFVSLSFTPSIFYIIFPLPLIQNILIFIIFYTIAIPHSMKHKTTIEKTLIDWRSDNNLFLLLAFFLRANYWPFFKGFLFDRSLYFFLLWNRLCEILVYTFLFNWLAESNHWLFFFNCFYILARIKYMHQTVHIYFYPILKYDHLINRI